jgi:hypothetical protein
LAEDGAQQRWDLPQGGQRDRERPERRRVANIQEGTQSATRFEIPAGYSKMDIGNMMQQHSAALNEQAALTLAKRRHYTSG